MMAADNQRAAHTVFSFGIFIFHTPPFALLSSSLMYKRLKHVTVQPIK